MYGVIAQRHILCIDGNGKRIKTIMLIGKPYPDGNDYACPVSLAGLEGNTRHIMGVDSFQAIILAFKFCLSKLENFVSGGGKIVSAEDNKEINLDGFFEQGTY